MMMRLRLVFDHCSYIFQKVNDEMIYIKAEDLCALDFYEKLFRLKTYQCTMAKVNLKSGAEHANVDLIKTIANHQNLKYN